ncbi:MAG TPA: ComF family protein [Nevskiaceae bacterium]|nr:ComF family protein [Nevskiaceae bacterium]
MWINVERTRAHAVAPQTWHARAGTPAPRRRREGSRSTMRQALSHLAVVASKLLAPGRCLLCNAPLFQTDGRVCPACLADLPWLRHACPRCAVARPDATLCPACAVHPPSQDSAWAAFRFHEPVRAAILALKYNAGFAQARWIGAAMADALGQRNAPLPECLLPVPLHATRLRRRGYNQALELARVIGHQLGIPVDWQALRRTRSTTDQIGQDRAARRRNLRGAFTAAPTLTGRHIALVDDVMTTGSTLAELAACCRAAGARQIEVWAAARA